MNKMIRKAKAGVTLVELLVVILIVTILAVSLLPLLKPYIEKAKYAAEPIPVLASLQTKIELYQYEKGKLPCASNDSTHDYYTWHFESSSSNYFPCTSENYATTTHATEGHLQQLTDTDWQDLTGKNMRPSDFQYVVTKNESSGTYCYAVGVFGGHNDSGLLAGTGYAICKIVDLGTSNKLVAVWERYKPTNTNPLSFVVDAAGMASEVWIPTAGVINGSKQGWDTLTQTLREQGWSF